MSDPLVCETYGRRDETGRAERWRAPLGREDDDTEVAVVMCPDCADEFDAHTGPGSEEE